MDELEATMERSNRGCQALIGVGPDLYGCHLPTRHAGPHVFSGACLGGPFTLTWVSNQRRQRVLRALLRQRLQERQERDR